MSTTTPHRIAQTSTELKKQYKKNGPRLPERQQKQLERAFELDQRAARIRETEDRRKAAKKKREDREEKEARARKQVGVGLATQLIGYSHTQAQLKSGMEAFLGVKKRQEEEKRKKEEEFAKRLEVIADDIDKEPWDDDDELDDIALHLPECDGSSGEQWVDEELDDDSLLEAHALVMSDPVEESLEIAQPWPAIAFPMPPTSTEQAPVKEEADFVQTHGPINTALEAILDKLPEPLIELLSQDLSMKLPDWDPELSLLHTLNPVGLPPHRLRIKIGCAVILLRDLNTSSQLSKSQHLQVLRADNDRLECLVLDGQLEGTRTILTRVAFLARYNNQEQHLFQRTQFPIRVATDYTHTIRARDTSQSQFKLPSMPGHVRPGLPKRLSSNVVRSAAQTNSNLGFKLPGLPASKSSSSIPAKHTPPIYPSSIDSWDDFFESGTQIARDLAVEVVPIPASLPKTTTSASPSIGDCLPPLSTQDFDFSLEDLDEETYPCVTRATNPKDSTSPAKSKSSLLPSQPVATEKQVHTRVTPSKVRSLSTALSTTTSNSKTSTRLVKPPLPNGVLSTCKPSIAPPPRKPPSVSDRPGLKRKTWTAQRNSSLPPPKRPHTPSSRPTVPAAPTVAPMSHSFISDFVMSTQEAASFFDDDESLNFGSSPVAA